MNDSMSILLATSILALGGLGLYLYRTKHEEQDGGDNKDKTETYDDDNEESIFGSGNLFNWGSSEDKDEDIIMDEELEENEPKQRKRNTGKTQRNKKQSGSSRRRY